MYQALYRKYRPIDFDSVVGQDPIVKTLKNSIINKNFSHAYMFYGSRGTGKTSVSKIFARNVNCLNPKDGNACGKCDNCKISFSKECVDIIEIDAASNNGVDEIRELKNNINLVPTDLKYKVYIVDEVHMLSDSAFNALLKTLEEPPAHVIFILATTDPQKVPDTIVSRCQCFSFKRISDEVIYNKLVDICGKEKIKVSDEVLRKISLLCDGGMRDALGSLDKLVSYSSTNITIDDFNEINGIISDDQIKKFVDNIFKGNISDVMLDISEFNSCGKNLIQIIIQIIDYVRNIILNYYINHSELNYSIDLYISFINLLNDKLVEIKKSGNTKIFFEMFLLKFMNDSINIVEKDIVENTNKIENKSNNNENDKKEIKTDDKRVETSKSTVKKENTKKVEEEPTTKEDFGTDNPVILNLDDINNIRINNAFATAQKALLKQEMNNFELLRDFSFDQEIGYVVNAILDSKLRVVGTDNMILSYDSDRMLIQNLSNYLVINDVYNKITNSNKKIAIISDKEWDKLKKEYIENKDNPDKYKIQEEPDVLLEEHEKNDIIVDSAISLFGDDIVEVE